MAQGTGTRRAPGYRQIGLLAAAAILALDQVTKFFALTLIGPRDVIEVTGFWNFVLVWNRGVSFGILGGSTSPFWQQMILIALALAVVIGLIVWLGRARHLRLALGLGAVIGGALGNALDRLMHGAVVDFLDFHAFGWHWPAFNIADCGIVIGAVVIAVDGLLTDGQESRNRDRSNEDDAEP